MSRNGSGVYSLPGTYEAVSGETIEAQQHNDPLEDLESDANTARPIAAGGTGAATAVDGFDNLMPKGSNIVSASTCDIGAATGPYVHITGTTAITGFGTKTAGVVRILTFDGALTLTYNATSLILPGAADIVTAAGDMAIFVSEGSGNWRCVSYKRDGGVPVVGGDIPQKVGRLTPHESLRIVYTSATTVTVTADALVLFNASGLPKRVTSWNNTGVITTSGAGGLDTGSEASDSWYYIWAIAKPDGTKSLLLSVSTDSPTLPSGYTYKGIIGAVLNASGDFVKFQQLDRSVFTTVVTASRIGGGALSATTYTVLPVGGFVPASLATQILLKVQILTSSGGPNSVVATLSSAGSGTTATYEYFEVQAKVDTTGETQTVLCPIDQPNGQIMYFMAGTNGNANIFRAGWVY